MAPLASGRSRQHRVPVAPFSPVHLAPVLASVTLLCSRARFHPSADNALLSSTPAVPLLLPLYARSLANWQQRTAETAEEALDAPVFRFRGDPFGTSLREREWLTSCRTTTGTNTAASELAWGGEA